MIKEYLVNFSNLSVFVMILFFVVFLIVVYQALRIGKQKSEIYSKLPIESEADINENINNRRMTDG